MKNKNSKELIFEYLKNKPNITNFYSLDFDGIECVEFENCLIILRQEINLSRLYFIARNQFFLSEALKEIKSKHVVNIPEKKNVCSFNEIFIKSGMFYHACYERWNNDFDYTNQNYTFSLDFLGFFAKPDHLDELELLLRTNFDNLSEHIPCTKALLEMINNNQVLLNFTNSKISGFFIFKMMEAKCYLNFWYDSSNGGLELLNRVFFLMKKNNVSYYYLWINAKNQRIKGLHKLFGASHDGTFDHVYSLNYKT